MGPAWMMTILVLAASFPAIEQKSYNCASEGIPAPNALSTRQLLPHCTAGIAPRRRRPIFSSCVHTHSALVPNLLRRPDE